LADSNEVFRKTEVPAAAAEAEILPIKTLLPIKFALLNAATEPLEFAVNFDDLTRFGVFANNTKLDGLTENVRAIRKNDEFNEIAVSSLLTAKTLFLIKFALFATDETVEL
jgi:hypothetical protein